MDFNDFVADFKTSTEEKSKRNVTVSKKVKCSDYYDGFRGNCGSRQEEKAKGISLSRPRGPCTNTCLIGFNGLVLWFTPREQKEEKIIITEVVRVWKTPLLNLYIINDFSCWIITVINSQIFRFPSLSL